MNNIIRSCRTCIHYIPPKIDKQSLDVGYGLCKLFRLSNVAKPPADDITHQYAVICRTKEALCGGKYYYPSPPFRR